MVLDGLSGYSFESLDKVDLEHVSHKTVSLLTVVSSKRVSALSASFMRSACPRACQSVTEVEPYLCDQGGWLMLKSSSCTCCVQFMPYAPIPTAIRGVEEVGFGIVG